MLNARARPWRSFAGKNDSRSTTPTRSNGGDWTSRTRSPIPTSFPSRQARPRRVETRMCSRLRIGSASTPMSESSPDTVAEIFSRVASGSCAASARRRTERSENRQRDPRGAARGEDRDRRRVAKPCDSRRILSPVRKPLPPSAGGPLRENVRRDPLPRRLLLVDPRPELARRQRRETRGAGFQDLLSDRWRSRGCRRSPPPRAARGTGRSSRFPSSRRTPRASGDRASRTGGDRLSSPPCPGRISGRGRRRRASRSPAWGAPFEEAPF